MMNNEVESQILTYAVVNTGRVDSRGKGYFSNHKSLFFSKKCVNSVENICKICRRRKKGLMNMKK